MPPINIRVSW